MKKILLIAILISSLFELKSQQGPALMWANQFGGSMGEQVTSVVTDASGNVYTTGGFSGIVDFDPGVGVYTLAAISSNTNAANYDIFLSKLDASGNFVWAKSFGNSSNGTDFGQNVALDSLGNVCFTGYFNGTVDFDPGPGVFNLSGISDACIVKMTSSGNLIWAACFGNNNIFDVTGQGIAVDAAGNVYTAGSFQDTTDFDPGPGVYTLTSASDQSPDIYVSKLDPSGNFIWAKRIGGTNYDYSQYLSIDGFGNVYTTGFFNGTCDFDPGSATYNLTSSGNRDIFISKLDPSGNFVWAKKMGGVLNEAAFSIFVTNSGRFYLTGHFSTTVDFDPGPGIYNLTSFGNTDIFVAKFNEIGDFVWAKSMGGTGTDRSLALSIDSQENVYTTGYFQFTSDFNPGPSTYTLAPWGTYDAYISKLDSAGNFVWASQISGSGYDQSYAIYVDNNDFVYIGGYFQNTSDFDPAYTTYNLTSLGGFDGYIIKYRQCSIPAAPLTSSSNSAICEGASVTLSASASGTVSWFGTSSSTVILNSGPTMQTPSLTAGTYTFFAETFSCTMSSSRAPISVIVNPNPTVLASTNMSIICRGEIAILTGSGAVNYSWSSGGVSVNEVVAPFATTSYTVTGIDENGCSNTAVVTQSVSDCTWLEGVLGEDLMGIFPNPFTHEITMELKEQGLLEITNSIGKVVTSVYLETGTQKINTENLAKGIYFLRFKSYKSVKLIKH